MKLGTSSPKRCSIALAATTLFVATASASPGQPIGPPIIASDDFVRLSTTVTVDVASNSAGAFVAVWEQSSGTNAGSTIVARRFAADGAAAGPPFVVTSEDSNLLVLDEPSVAMDAEGDFVIAWELVEVIPGQQRLTTRSSRSRVLAQRYSADGTAQGEVIDVAMNAEAPDVAMDDDGDFVIGWAVDGLISQLAAPVYGLPILIPGATLPDHVRLRRYSADGRPRGLVQTLDTRVRSLPLGNLPAVNDVRVAMDGVGNVTAAWTRNPTLASDSVAIFGQRLAANGFPRGAVFRISGDDEIPRGSGGAELDMNVNGRFVVAWPGAESIRAGVYEADGSVVVPAFAVSDPAVAVPLSLRASPGVVIDEGGNFAVCGFSTAQFDAGTSLGGQNLRLFSANGTALTGNLNLVPPQRFAFRFDTVLTNDGAGNLLLQLDNPSLVRALRLQRYAGAQ